MSQTQNAISNGPFEEAPELKSYEPVKTLPSGNGVAVQPIYSPQQVDGNPRPPLLRLDSRSSLPPRPILQNQVLRPPIGQPRPPPPGGTQFVQRPPFQQRPPGPGNQGVYSQPVRFPQPDGIQQNAPRQMYNVGPPNLIQRHTVPYPRPQGSPIRPPNATLYQQRTLPTSGSPRPFSGYPPQRSQTLDPEILNRNADTVDLASPVEKTENTKPTILSMQNRSQSVVSGNIDTRPDISEDRRRSISSIGSIEEERVTSVITSYIPNGKMQNDIPSRPESRADVHMNRIEEDANKAYIAINKSPTTTSSTESLDKKVTPMIPQETTTNIEPQKNTNPVITSPLPPKTPPPPEVTEPVRRPIINNEPLQEVISNVKQSGSKSPGPKSIGNLKLSLSNKTEGDNDSGVDETTQVREHISNGSPKPSTKISTPRSSTTPTKNKSFTRVAKSPSLKSPDTPTDNSSTSTEKKKVPMNKIQVGSAPSPNLKVVRSKIGSLANASHKPGGGHVKIENRKIDFGNTSSRIAAKNDTYTPGGGDKKIEQKKLAWNAKSKVGSLENTGHTPKGGDKKIESIKLDFKDKAKPKIGSKDNMKHVPGGGDIKIESKKVEIKVQSKIGSMDNIKHKPGGGDKKIFNDKEYLRQMSAQSNASLEGSQKKARRPDSISLRSKNGNVVSPNQQKVRIYEEVVVHEFPSPNSRPSSRLSRSGSSRNNRPETPRPPWRY